MRSVRRYLCALSVLVFALALGCASEEPPPSFPDAPVYYDAPSFPDARPPDAPLPDARQCVPTCGRDDDCQVSCPAVPNAVPCCDQGTGTCYNYNGLTCPAPPPPDGGTNPYP